MRFNVSKAIIHHPYFDGWCQPLMVICSQRSGIWTPETWNEIQSKMLQAQPQKQTCTLFSQFTINNNDTIVHHPQVYSHNRGMLNFSKLYPAAHQSQVTFLELTARVIGTFGALSDHSVPRCPAALRKVPAGGWSLSARWTPVELSDS